MIERREGAIVIVSSITGLKGNDVIGAYGISKAADMALARNLAVEWGPHNVRVNCIAPGLIMNCESLISRRVVLTGFSRIRGRLRGGKAMKTKKSVPEEVMVHRSR
jgi:NAD(P)-dependent dehydrogenase (short-subunit alcohol dehydrogenase family)